MWQGIQDNKDDGEALIIDGSIYGRRDDAERRLSDEEHAQA